MNIEYISNHLFNLLEIPVYLHKTSRNIKIFESYQVPLRLQNIIDANRLQMINQEFDGSIYRLIDYSRLSYFSFLINNTKIVIGPYLEEEIKSSVVSSLAGRLKLLREDIKVVEQFYNSLKVINNEEIGFIIDMYLGLIDDKSTKKSYKSIDSIPVKQSKEIDLENLFVELEYVRHNYEIEDRLSTVIESGDIDGATSFPTREIMKQLPKRALHDSLRNAKTRLTILNTLCNRAAIRGGIDIQLGHQISTNYGIIIEGMKYVLKKRSQSHMLLLFTITL